MSLVTGSLVSNVNHLMKIVMLLIVVIDSVF